MKPLYALLLALGLGACGVDGPPSIPGSGIDPTEVAPDVVDPDDFFD